MEELAKEQKRKVAKRRAELKEAGIDVADVDNEKIDGLEASAASMLEFLEKARSGELIPPDVIIRYANLFQDDLTLDNMPRMQLINMCKYMAIPPYGSESFLRFQLRHRIRVLKEDDQRILWEGIDSLTKRELREACQERGMRSTGLSKEAYKRSLQQWLDLSVNKNVPISLLVMSRTFFLNKEENLEKSDDGSQSVTGLADAISGLDKDVLDQVILEVATSQEKTSDPEITKLKLEVLSQQNELIRQEKAEREAAASKKKEAAEKETAEQESSGEETKESAAAPSDAAASLAAAPLVPPVAEDVRTEPPSETKKDNGEKDESLSTEEMDLLSQIVSGDPVSKERAELERIKAAMKSEASIKEVAKTLVSVPQQDASSSEPMTSEEAERMVADTVEKLEQQVKAAAEGSTQFSLDGSNTSTENSTETVDEEEEEEPEDPVVARLKKKLESMVDKIEVQLTDAHIKIGNKMHLLDKDNDGILTREEMADALQSVLKREITFEEAMVIADEMVRYVGAMRRFLVFISGR
jgi:LETM1 and EF-hand domain-containing protein 1